MCMKTKKSFTLSRIHTQDLQSHMGDGLCKRGLCTLRFNGRMCLSAKLIPRVESENQSYLQRTVTTQTYKEFRYGPWKKCGSNLSYNLHDHKGFANIGCCDYGRVRHIEVFAKEYCTVDFHCTISLSALYVTLLIGQYRFGPKVELVQSSVQGRSNGPVCE